MRRASAVSLREPEAMMAPQSLHPKIRSLQLDLELKRRFAASCEGGGFVPRFARGAARGGRGERGGGEGVPLPPFPPGRGSAWCAITRRSTPRPAPATTAAG